MTIAPRARVAAVTARRSATTATNLGGTPCPYAAGQHPYLPPAPMTCAPNGFRSGDGLLQFDSGQTITTRWGIYPD